MRIVCSGAFIYQYIPSDKEIVAHEMPKPKAGQVSDDNLLSFLLGMKKDDARKRYDLKLSKTKEHPDGTDENYVYVDIQPRFAADEVDFKRAQIILIKDTPQFRAAGIAWFPRQLWFESPNSTQTTWRVSEIKVNDKSIERREFDAPTPPDGWKMVQAPKDAETPPRVVRPSGS
jgi:TIGR03009 family protein